MTLRVRAAQTETRICGWTGRAAMYVRGSCATFIMADMWGKSSTARAMFSSAYISYGAYSPTNSTSAARARWSRRGVIITAWQCHCEGAEGEGEFNAMRAH